MQLSYKFSILLRKILCRSHKFSKNGHVAITGSTSGIGFYLSQEFARRFYNMLLISRDQNKLKNQTKQLEEKFKAQSNHVVCDFAVPLTKQIRLTKFYQDLFIQLNQFSINTVINNVGVWKQVKYFHESKNEELLEYLYCNICPSVFINFNFMKKLASNNEYSIIQISSQVGLRPTPFIQIYGPSKKSVDSLTLGLRGECKDKKNLKIHVGIVRPSTTRTEIFKNDENVGYFANFVGVSAESFAKQAMQRIGKSQTAGHLEHIFQEFMLADLHLIPDCVFYKAWKFIFCAKLIAH